MQIVQTDFEGLFVIEPTVYSDERGYFFESFRQDCFREHIGEVDFVQENESMSSYGVVRGLHLQVGPHAQSKLVRVVQGKVQDVVLDLRKDSATYGRHYSIELSSENKKQLFVPKGFAHGFAALSEQVTMHYMMDGYYHQESERGIHPVKNDYEISWQVKQNDMLLSEKDKAWPRCWKKVVEGGKKYV